MSGLTDASLIVFLPELEHVYFSDKYSTFPVVNIKSNKVVSY